MAAHLPHPHTMTTSLKLILGAVKWLGVALAMFYGGFKYVQHEFRVIAQDVVMPEIKTIEKLRENDMRHLDKRFDRIEQLIIRRKK